MKTIWRSWHEYDRGDLWSPRLNALASGFSAFVVRIIPFRCPTGSLRDLSSWVRVSTSMDVHQSALRA